MPKRTGVRLMPLLLAAVATLSLAPGAEAAVNTFDGGAVDNAWNRASNWSDGVPTADDQVVIPALETADLASGAAGVAAGLDLGGSLNVNGRGLTLGAGGTSTLAGALSVSNATVSLAGTVDWSAGSIDLTSATLVNAGTLTVSAGGATLSYGGGVATLDNDGTLVADGSGTFTVGPALRTSGSLQVLAGTLVPHQNVLVESGTVSVAAGATLGSAGRTITLQAGKLSGDGTVAGTLSQTGGTLAPGAPLTVAGSYTQGQNALLEVGIGGAAPNHDALAVNGTANVSGDVVVVNAPGHDPAPGSTFDIVAASTLIGTFDQLLGAQLAGKHFAESYPGGGIARLVVTADAPPAPVNTGAPAIPTVARVGDSLTCSPGSWTPAPTELAFSWTRDQNPIAGQTTDRYSVTAADLGRTVACVVVASNQGVPSQPARSNGVVPGLAPAANTVAPSISGEPEPGQTLTCSPGEWTGTPQLTIEWLRDGTVVRNGPSYAVASSDLGHAITCRVTAVNGGGRAQAHSAAVTPARPGAAPAATSEETGLASAPGSTVAGAFGLPSARRCVSRRNFTIRLRTPRGVTIARARVKVNRRAQKVRRIGGRLTARVDLRGLPRGRFTVEIAITTRSGLTIKGKRAYRTCAGRSGRDSV